MYFVLICIQVIFQFLISHGTFLYAYRKYSHPRLWIRRLLLFCLLVHIAFNITNNMLCRISTIEVCVTCVFTIVWLRMWTGQSWFTVSSWGIFINGFLSLLQLQVVIYNCLIGGVRLKIANYTRNPISILIFLIEMSFLILILYINKNKKNIFWIRILEKHWPLLGLLGMGELAAGLYIMSMLYYKAQTSALVLYVVFLLFIVCVYLLLCIGIQYGYAREESELLRRNDRLLQDKYQMLSEEQRRVQKMLHEHRHELNYIRGCLENNQQEKAIAFMDQKIRLGQSKIGETVWTGNGLVDYLLNNYARQMEERHIKLWMEAEPFQIPIAECDFFELLGNLLENALEAAMQCREKGFVRIKLQTVNQMFYMLIENAYLVEPVKKGDYFLTTKTEGSNHGWGLRSIMQIVDKYQGICDVEYGDGKFRVQIMLKVWT